MKKGIMSSFIILGVLLSGCGSQKEELYSSSNPVDITVWTLSLIHILQDTIGLNALFIFVYLMTAIGAIIIFICKFMSMKVKK